MNPQQGQLGGSRGLVPQENFMGTPGNRPMGPRGNVSFMPPQQQQQGMGGPMQAGYPSRPNMAQQGGIPGQMQGGQMTQGE